LERQDIGIGGLMGGIVSGMLIRYPTSTEKSIYATIEPFQYQVNNYWLSIRAHNFLLILQFWYCYNLDLVGNNFVIVGCRRFFLVYYFYQSSVHEFDASRSTNRSKNNDLFF